MAGFVWLKSSTGPLYFPLIEIDIPIGALLIVSASMRGLKLGASSLPSEKCFPPESIPGILGGKCSFHCIILDCTEERYKLICFNRPRDHVNNYSYNNIKTNKSPIYCS